MGDTYILSRIGKTQSESNLFQSIYGGIMKHVFGKWQNQVQQYRHKVSEMLFQ